MGAQGKHPLASITSVRLSKIRIRYPADCYMLILAPLLLVLAVGVVFVRGGNQLSPEVIFLLGWTGGLSFAAFLASAVRWVRRGGWHNSRSDRPESSVPRPYERARYF